MTLEDFKKISGAVEITKELPTLEDFWFKEDRFFTREVLKDIYVCLATEDKRYKIIVVVDKKIYYDYTIYPARYEIAKEQFLNEINKLRECPKFKGRSLVDYYKKGDEIYKVTEYV